MAVAAALNRQAPSPVGSVAGSVLCSSPPGVAPILIGRHGAGPVAWSSLPGDHQAREGQRRLNGSTCPGRSDSLSGGYAAFAPTRREWVVVLPRGKIDRFFSKF
jgi:hypothetical protein